MTARSTLIRDVPTGAVAVARPGGGSPITSARAGGAASAALAAGAANAAHGPPLA
jgi:hypothetical protein